jgi:mevalonate kinase
LKRNIQKATDELKALGLKGDLPSAKAKITRAKKAIEKGELTQKDLESTEFDLKKRTDRLLSKALSRPTDTGSVGRRLESVSVVENLRQYNPEQVAKVKQVLAETPAERFDTVDGAKQDLADQQAEISELADELGVSSDVPKELLDEADDIETYSNVMDAAASCMLRRA